MTTHKRRAIIAADNIGKVCGCQSCVEAGVADKPMRRVPGLDGTPRFIHGEELRRWLEAYNTLRQNFRHLIDGHALSPKRGPHSGSTR